MSRIFLGYHQHDTKRVQPVAIKVMPNLPRSDRRFFRELFLHEAYVALKARHPNLPEAYIFGEKDGRYFLVMELIDGPDLLRLAHALHMQGRRLSFKSVVQIGVGISAALIYLHKFEHLKIVHGDIHPSNVMLTHDGRVKIVDFGISVSSASLPRGRHWLGRFENMSPEQIGRRDIGPASDLFSLGLCLWTLLTAQSPFLRKTEAETKSMILLHKAPRLSSLVRSVPVDLDELVSQLLEKDPERRPSNASVVHRCLLKILKQCDASQSDLKATVALIA